jgi:hypothetical protein
MGISVSGARFWILLLVVALSPTITGEARAQVSAAERAKARKAMNEADALREAGDLRGAMDKYAIAHEVLRQPTTGLELATTQAALGLLVEARLTAADTAKLPLKKDEPAIFAESRRDAVQLAAELEPRVPALTLTVTPDVRYTLRIDGMQVPERAHGLRFRTNPGDHVVEVIADGHRPAKQHVVLGEGVNQLLHVALTPLSVAAAAPAPALAEKPEPAPAPAPAPASVASAPPPPAAEPVAPSPAEVPAPLEAPLPPPDPYDPYRAKRTRGYIAVIAGGVVFVGGAVSGILSITETSTAKRECAGDRCPLHLRNRLETADTLANIANVTMPLGVLGVAYGVYELLTVPDEKESRATRLDLQIGARGVLATLRGAL